MNRLLFLALLLPACGSGPKFEQLDYSRVSTAPNVVDLEPTQIRLAHGVAVAADIDALRPNGKKLESVAFQSSDESVVGVARGPDSRWVFFGAGLGRTQIQIFSKGKRKGQIEALVVRQSELSSD